MKLNITKLLFITASFFFVALALPSSAKAASPDIHGEVYVSGTDSYINPGGLRLWVKMTDNRSGATHYRYNRASSVDGHYTFFSWQDVARTNPEGMVNTWIVPDYPELAEETYQKDSRYVRQADSVQYVECEGGCPTVGFGCSELPLTITIIKPWNWSGSFSTVTINPNQVDPRGQTYSNGAFTFEAPPIYYSGTNQASCTNFSAPDSVTANQSFTVLVKMNNPQGGNSWSSNANYRLGRQGDSDWIFPNGNQDRVNLPSSPINGGDSANFSFNVKAPNSSGTKNFGVQMVQEGVEWFGGICSKSITVQPTGTPTSPSIQFLQIRDAVTNTQKDGKRISGLSANQGGSGFNNPLVITLNATAGSAQSTSYYMAFYDQSGGLISNSSQFLSTVQSRLNDLKNGILLRYDSDGKYYVWTKDRWADITTLSLSGYTVCTDDNCVSNPILYIVRPGNSAKQWRLFFDKNFGSKNMYTAAYVLDSNNLSSYTGGDITPQ